jgi:DNA-binding response OmpR family regulator
MKRILIVDDEPSVREPLREAFEGAGFSVTCAQEKEEAEALLATRHFDFVISDLRLGDLFGFSGLHVISEAVRRVGSENVLAMAGVANSEVRTAVALKGVSLLNKPFPLKNCVALCSALLR